jgi:hypothetical protein
MKNNIRHAQRSSIGSEWGKSANAGVKSEKSEKRKVENETASVQRLSNSSASAISPLRPLCLFRPLYLSPR